jgi:O-antigen ligase
MIPGRVRWATGLAFVLHGGFILTARYRLSYDAYNHMFFGDHYRLDWWTLWEPRWYTGFEINSYPPLVHQLIGLLGHLIGVDAAFGLILWTVLTAYPLAIYAFSRVFTGKTAAGYAALGAAVLPSIYLAAHTFGQLPTLTSGLFALFALASLNDFLKGSPGSRKAPNAPVGAGRLGNSLSGALTISLFAIVMAAHHATLLFLPFIIAALLIHLALNEKLNWKTLLLRLISVGLLSVAAGLLVIWPFWVWGSTQTMQTPIDHASRHSFFLDPFALMIFFLPIYGPLIPLIPVILWKGLRRRPFGLWVAFLFLFVLGLGGTTPLPRWLFGSNWEWLTYDRFALWASWIMLPFIGKIAVVTRYKFSWLSRWRSLIVPGGLVVLGAVSIISGLLPTLLPTQPTQIDMQPIVQFLAKDDRSQWRYVTFGLGDQLAYLSRLTKATTIDGSYHTARSLPEMRSSGIAQIDTAFWLSDGFSRLDTILQKSGERGVRWGFVNRFEYIPILHRNGWVYVTMLANDIQVWENPEAIFPTPIQPPAESPLKQFSWGVFPLFALSLSGALALKRYWPAVSARLLPAFQALVIGLLPFGLAFWYYRPLFAFPHDRIYFTYSDALFFLSDGLAMVIVLTGFISRWPHLEIPNPPFQLRKYFSQPAGWLFSLCLLATLSTLWSLDWRTSLYISLQMWLCFALYHSLSATPRAWRWFTLGSCAVLAIQIWVGFWQFTAQSTLMNKPLDLNWPGNLLPTMTGASVVQLADGIRWLRAYGTFPHPNLLGGFGLTLLTAPLILYLLPSKRPVLSLILFNAGLALLVLTFSRSAWLALGVLCTMLLLHWKKIGTKKLVPPIFSALVTLAGLFAWLSPLFFTRVVDSSVQTEQVSNYTRLWLVQRTLELIQQRPFLGAGIGAYSLALSQHVAEFYKIEPVHNIPLLVISELGPAGLFLLGGLVIVIIAGAFRAHKPLTVVFSGLLLGLFTISLFDHYFWTLAPGRMLIFTILGLWSGEVQSKERRD